MAVSHGIMGPIARWGANPVIRFGIGGGVHLDRGSGRGVDAGWCERGRGTTDRAGRRWGGNARRDPGCAVRGSWCG